MVQRRLEPPAPRGCRDVRGMSRKRRTRLRLHDLGRLRRVDDRRESRGNVPPSPFCLLVLEAPRGLRRVSARRPTRDLRWRAAHTVSMTPANESSRCGAGLRSVRPPSGEAWQLAFSSRPVNSGASVSRAASRTPGHRPLRASRTPRRRRPHPGASERGGLWGRATRRWRACTERRKDPVCDVFFSVRPSTGFRSPRPRAGSIRPSPSPSTASVS